MRNNRKREPVAGAGAQRSSGDPRAWEEAGRRKPWIRPSPAPAGLGRPARTRRGPSGAAKAEMQLSGSRAQLAVQDREGWVSGQKTGASQPTVQSLSHVRLFATPWTAARQASLSITNSRSLLRLVSIESMMPSSHLILCHPLLLLPLIPSSIRVFSTESTLHMRWPKY